MQYRREVETSMKYDGYLHIESVIETQLLMIMITLIPYLHLEGAGEILPGVIQLVTEHLNCQALQGLS